MFSQAISPANFATQALTKRYNELVEFVPLHDKPTTSHEHPKSQFETAVEAKIEKVRPAGRCQRIDCQRVHLHTAPHESYFQLLDNRTAFYAADSHPLQALLDNNPVILDSISSQIHETVNALKNDILNDAQQRENSCTQRAIAASNWHDQRATQRWELNDTLWKKLGCLEHNATLAREEAVIARHESKATIERLEMQKHMLVLELRAARAATETAELKTAALEMRYCFAPSAHAPVRENLHRANAIPATSGRRRPGLRPRPPRPPRPSSATRSNMTPSTMPRVRRVASRGPREITRRSRRRRATAPRRA